MASDVKTWVNKRLNPQMEWAEVEEWVDARLKSKIDKRDRVWARMHRQAVDREALRENYTNSSDDYRKWSLQHYVSLRTRETELKVWQEFIGHLSTVRMMARMRIPRMPRRPVNDVLDSRLWDYEAKRDEMLGRLNEIWQKEPRYAPPYNISQNHRRLSASGPLPSTAPGDEESAPSVRPPSYDGAPLQQSVSAGSEVARTARATLPGHAASDRGTTHSSSPPRYSVAVQGRPAVAAREQAADNAAEASPPRTPTPGSTTRPQVSRPASPSGEKQGGPARRQ